MAKSHSMASHQSPIETAKVGEHGKVVDRTPLAHDAGGAKNELT